MSARFELVRTDAEQPWHVRFVAPNGRIVWTTEQYGRRKSAINAVSSLCEGLLSGWVEMDWLYTKPTRSGQSYRIVRSGPAVVYRRDSWNKTNGLRMEIREVDEREAAR